MIRIAVVDANAERRQAAAARLRGAAVLAVNEPAAQADGIAFFHAPTPSQWSVDQALQAGKHVLLVIDDAWSCDNVRRWMGAPRVAVVNPDRHLPSRQLIRQQLDAGKLGEVGLIRIHRWDTAARDAALLRDLDVILWYFAKAPNVVFAAENGHCTQIHLGFPGGGMALLDHGRRLPAGDRYYSLAAIGASGAAYADDHANMQLAYQGGTPRAIRAEEGVSQFAALLQSFADAIAGGDSHRADVSAWHDVFAVSDAIGQSLRSKQAVHREGVLP